MEWYAEASQSALSYLLLESLGLRDMDGKTAQAASHVGCCAGIVTLLRAFPHHLAQVQCGA